MVGTFNGRPGCLGDVASDEFLGVLAGLSEEFSDNLMFYAPVCLARTLFFDCLFGS